MQYPNAQILNQHTRGYDCQKNRYLNYSFGFILLLDENALYTKEVSKSKPMNTSFQVRFRKG